jgi:hypothetical protein
MREAVKEAVGVEEAVLHGGIMPRIARPAMRIAQFRAQFPGPVVPMECPCNRFDA